MPQPAPTPDPTFEQAMAQLESIVERIESGEAGLEQSIAEYEKGVALVKRCREILGKAEQRVAELSGHLAELDNPGTSRKDA